MPRSQHPKRTSTRPQPSPLFRTRNWLGQERVAFTYRKRRYTFRRAEAAAWARHRILQEHRPYKGYMLLLALLITVLTVAWIVSVQPVLLLRSVDAVRAVVGPEPVAYVESQVFRVGTLIREWRVGAGETSPRWSVQGAVAAEHGTATLAPSTSTSTPTLAPTPTLPATPTPQPELITIARGGNLRREPVVNAENVIGWVMSGDEVAVVERTEQGWLRVRLLAVGPAENTQPVNVGTVGWISRVLLEPETPTATLAPPTATPKPTAPLLFDPSPVPPTAVSSTRAFEPTTAVVAPTTNPLLQEGT